MHFDISLVLVIVSVITGVIWLVDRLAFAKRRVIEGGVEPSLVENARSFFPVSFILLIVISFVAQPFRIPSNSMMPTLLTGDFILVNKFGYGIRLPVVDKKIIPIGAPKRGDVVVFRYPLDVKQDYIKRVIGLPGDEIDYRNKQLRINGQIVEAIPQSTYKGVGSGLEMTGAVLINETLAELPHQILIDPRQQRGPQGEGVWKVPEGHYFVMGDNRDHSADSRFWGVISEDHLVGKAFLIWMNWDGKSGGIDFSRLGSGIH